jgi:hypothetical protein
MQAIVADTSPLNYLVLIQAFDILPSLYRRVLISPAVSAELAHANTPTAVRAWISQPPQWLEVVGLKQPVDPALAHLDAGEREAISLAATANQRSGDANSAAGTANVRAGNLEKEAAEARKTTEKLREQNLATETHLSEANLRLEQERIKRLEMEAWLAPREMDQSPGKLGGLIKFSGTHVELVFLVDAEVKRAAGQIRALCGCTKDKQ